MNISTLPSITKRRKKRMGLGHGSGRGKTAGRGTKGQKARRDIPLHMDGADLAFLQRIPFMRGKGRNSVLFAKPMIVNVGQLNKLPDKSVVDLELLISKGLVSAKEAKSSGVKILGEGELTAALDVRLMVSKGAVAKIEKAGGNVVKSS